MALYVNTNVSSLNARRNLSNSTTALDTSYKRLASGLRINSAKDDAAGLQISNRLTSQINGLEQGNRNAQDGISYSQTAEGAMDEITNMFQRIRTLALQSANGTNSEKDRKAIQQEVSQLCLEIDRISTDTTFGGTKILDGENSVTAVAENKAINANDGVVLDDNQNKISKSISFQVGADANQTIGIDLALKAGDKKVGFSVAGIAKSTGISNTVVAADAADTARTTGYIINSNNGLAFDVGTQLAAQAVVGTIDKFISAVDSKRAELGAVQNRLESTIRNQSNISENVSDARSRIRDTDFATETANMTQQNILQQAAQSILSQANQRPQIALSLLQQ
ncbi:MAG: flagellin [Succinivibrionaceae bacterium]|nr:flagellin [Succinivibrionaceae bacterium]